MAELNDKLLFATSWFGHLSKMGIANATDTLKGTQIEGDFVHALILSFLDAQRGDADFRHADALSFYTFCQPLLHQSHAQILQDLWVLFVLSNKRDGYFVEFGACDGRSLSNTRLLEERYGWTGILAEPNPVWHDHLRQNRICTIDTDCVSVVTGETVDFISTDKMPELSRMATFVPDDIHERNGNRDKQTLYQVKTVSLVDLLERHNAPSIIDYLSIDTEGSEYEILRDFDFTRYQFRTLTIEHAGETAKRQAIYELLTAKGYSRWHPGLSRWDDWYIGPSVDR